LLVHRQGSKRFFFEKKNQKTFITSGHRILAGLPQGGKKLSVGVATLHRGVTLVQRTRILPAQGMRSGDSA
jgi:hypothetical protein